MGRLNPGLAIAVAGALLLLLSSHARAAATVHSSGSLEIREAATLSVAKQPSLQLLLSSGTDTTYTMTAPPGGPSPTGTSATPVLISSGPWAGTTSSGEVLSVSLTGAGGEESSSAGQGQIRYIIAQFN